MRKWRQRKENRIPVTSVKFMEVTSGNTVNLTLEVPTLINKLMTNTKPTSKEEEALVEVLAEAKEAEASMEAEALVEDHLKNSTISRIIIILQISPIQTDHLQQSTLISRAMLYTVTTVHHLPEEISTATITETRQSTALQQLMLSLKILSRACRQW